MILNGNRQFVDIFQKEIAESQGFTGVSWSFTGCARTYVSNGQQLFCILIYFLTFCCQPFKLMSTSSFQTCKASSKLWPPISHSIELLPHPVSMETNTTYRTIYCWTGYDVMLSNNLRGVIVIGLSKHIQFGSCFGMANEHPKHRKGHL